MPRLFFFGAAAIVILASLAARHWRNERFAAIAKQEHVKTARAVVAAPTVPGTSGIPVSASVAPAKPAEPTGASFREAMQPEATEARRAKDPKLQALHVRTLRLELLLKNGPFLRNRALSGEARDYVGKDH